MKIFRFLRITAATATLSGALTASVWAQDHAAPKYKVNMPPSADLSYEVKARQSGLSLDGDARVKWNVGDNKFQLVTEMRAMLIGKILEAKSEGSIDAFGLAPATFTEKRFRKDANTVSFNRENKTITFSGSAESYPIVGGEQDRNSAIWQLASVARAAPEKFRQGSEWTFFVVGQRDADLWTFKVLKREKLKTPMGELDAVHILKTTRSDAKGQHQQLDIWLAPGLEWYPVRLRYTDPDEDFIEQTLAHVTPKPS